MRSREIGGKAVGRKSERASIRRPDRLQIGKRIVRQPIQLAGLEIVHEEIGKPPDEAGKGDEPSVRRPAGVEDLIQAGELDFALHLLPPDVVETQHRPARRNSGEGEAGTIRAPAARGLDELQALVVWIDGRLGDLPLYLAGTCVS